MERPTDPIDAQIYDLMMEGIAENDGAKAHKWGRLLQKDFVVTPSPRNIISVQPWPEYKTAAEIAYEQLEKYQAEKNRATARASGITDCAREQED